VSSIGVMFAGGARVDWYQHRQSSARLSHKYCKENFDFS